MITKGTFLPNYIEIGPLDSDKKIFKSFFILSVAMANRILHGFQIFEDFSVSITQGSILQNLVKIDLVV